ncbi:low molecular weight protein tyrosine phosphatase [Piscinibacter sakaiensis]|uniref:Low molecular weight protein tyrosine phosphatase n=1 Tax=Piscinibacter sakaiensis TaxID=1547922 RepID=A0A0K8NYC7_PISS1|nr:low molecular weight protein tyrosine phosphatase [Piscinibacter sakaiensis]
MLFVCLGNICRSPTAHAVFREQLRRDGLLGRVEVASAGTYAGHAGEPPDARSQRHAARRGYDLSDLRSTPLLAADFARHDLVLVMDEMNLAACRRQCPPALQDRLRGLAGFCRRHRVERVPDPYEGGAQGFEHVLDLVEDACEGLLEHVRAELARRPAA